MDIVDLFFYIFGFAVVIYSVVRKHITDKLEDEIIKTRIVDIQSRSRSTTRTSSSSAIKRAAVGGVLVGRKGAEFGAYTAKKHTITDEDDTVVFKVWWVDGDKTIEKVKRGSAKYELFLEYLED